MDSMNSTQNLAFKFLMIGDAGVGKTSLVHRLCLDEFSQNIASTIGTEYMVYKLSISDTKVQLQIWDTAGQEQYRSLVRSYYRDAVGVMLVFSFTNHDSLDGLEEWLADVRNYCNPKVKVLLVGNKIDLEEERAVSKVEIELFAKNHKLEYIETSAKTNANVKEAFHKAARAVFQSFVTNEITIGPQPDDIPRKRPPPVTEQNNDSCC